MTKPLSVLSSFVSLSFLLISPQLMALTDEASDASAVSQNASSKVQVNWEKPEDFTDMRPVNQPRTRFRERTMQIFDEYINELAVDYLTADQTLTMKVTDVDLAGQVWPAQFTGLGPAGNDVRLVQRVFIPRMDFSYQLKDANGEIIQEEEVKLKDMNFIDRGYVNFRRNEPFRYEKAMLKRWFRQAFADEETSAESVDINPT